MIKIPKQFDLFGCTWKVEFNNTRCNDLTAYGYCDYTTKTILLSDLELNNTLTEDLIIQTYIHEIIHAILDSMYERELSKNEKFVDMFSQLLYQLFKSAKYDG